VLSFLQFVSKWSNKITIGAESFFSDSEIKFQWAKLVDLMVPTFFYLTARLVTGDEGALWWECSCGKCYCRGAGA